MDRFLSYVKEIMFSDGTVEEKKARLGSFLIKSYTWIRDNVGKESTYDFHQIRMDLSSKTPALAPGSSSDQLVKLAKKAQARGFTPYLRFKICENIDKPEPKSDDCIYFESKLEWEGMSVEEKEPFMNA